MAFIEKYRYTPKEKYEEIFDSKSLKDVNKSSHKKNTINLLIVLNALFLAFYMSTEISYLEFISTYLQYIPLKLTAKTAAEIASASALSYTIGRGISVLIAIKVKPQNLIQSHLLIIFIAMSVIMFGQNSMTMLWIGCVGAGYGFSPIYAAIYSMIKEHIEVNDKIGGILLFATDSINVLLPYVLGKFIETTPDLFVYIILMNASLSVFVFISILYTIYCFNL